MFVDEDYDAGLGKLEGRGAVMGVCGEEKRGFEMYHTDGKGLGRNGIVP